MRTLARLLLGLVVAAACSPPDVGNTSAVAACGDYAYAFCTHLNDCSQALVRVRYGDEHTCETLIGANCVNAINAPSTGLTPSFEETCSKILPAVWGCTDFENLLNPPPQCALPPGLVPNGQACAFATQCQSVYCAIPIGSMCGTCAPAPNVGDSCANVTTCGRGLDCNQSQCAAFGSVGDSCANAPCRSGLGCSNGTCETPTETAGAPCGGSDALLCDFNVGLICNTQTLVCANAQFAGYGDSCAVVGGQRAICAGGASCNNAVCSVDAPVGAPCDLVQIGCIGPSRCIVSSDGGTSGVCLDVDASSCH